MISLVEDPATTIDPQAAYQHVRRGDSWRMVRLGARDLYYSEESGYVQFDIKISRKLRVIVKLAADDTYAVEIGCIRRVAGMPEYQVLAQERGHYTDSMGPAVERMALACSE